METVFQGFILWAHFTFYSGQRITNQYIVCLH